MNEAQFHLNMPSDDRLKLSAAVLIYRGTGQDALATLHDIHEVEGETVIGAGRPMTPRKALELSRALLKRVAHGGFLPSNVLYLDADAMVWWMPPAQRHVAFRVEPGEEATFGGAERGATVPHPGLVFAASSRTWRVWAVKGDQRPTPATTLWQAPYFNIDAQGRICQGSAPRPDGTAIEKIEAWNDAFFRSYFTHPNVPGQLLRYGGGAYAFWRDMLDGRFRRFPERVLRTLDTTLGEVLGVQGRPS
jgi:PRTRC genetic system protein B